MEQKVTSDDGGTDARIIYIQTAGTVYYKFTLVLLTMA
jgi:hypothetical protein